MITPLLTVNFAKKKMIDIIDGPKGKDDWAHVNWEEETIWFEESDTTIPLECSAVVITRGKYAGSYLSELSDSWYLQFIRDKNPDDFLITFMFDKRLGELKD